MPIKTYVPLSSLLRRCDMLGLALLLLSATVIAAQDPQKVVKVVVEQQPIDLSGDCDGITAKQSGQSVSAYVEEKCL